MTFDFPFWTWVLTRRLPYFALVATLVALMGASLVSRHTPNYHSSAKLLINPVGTQNNSVDAKTQFEFLKFRALTSGKFEAIVAQLGLSGDPLARVTVNHNPNLGHVSIGYHDQDPEIAFAVTRAITSAFVHTAKQLRIDDVERRVEIHEGEVTTLHDELARGHNANPLESDQRLKEELYQDALANLATALADLQATVPEILSVVQHPTLAASAAGPSKNALYLAVLSFAIFCGIIVVLVLEWTDTLIRRPNDIENTLGFATFGVIPDLQAVPITTTSTSTRGF